MTIAAAIEEAVSACNSESHPAPLRVAVIGCGPKGLYCLESLSRELKEKCDEAHHPTVEVVIYEPADFPGAGTVYAPTQPHFLRMNFASRHVDAWTPDSRRHGPAPSLTEWLSQHHCENSDPDAFAPRALVGEYLYWCFQRVVESLKQFANVKRMQCKVEHVDRQDSAWLVKTQESSELFDEVLITVGHEGWRPARSARKNSPISRLEIDCPFPVTRRLSVDQIPPGSRVAIRGFALTWIDTTLALTEGRGGRFEQFGSSWKYEPSGLEPISIKPFSRTGRPMLPKPCTEKLDLPSDLDDVWRRGRKRIMQLPTGTAIDFAAQVWPILLDACAAALHLIQVDISEVEWSGRVAAWWEDWNSSRCSADSALRQLRGSYDVAVGNRMPNEPWALGDAWRCIYPALVSRVSHGGLADRSWKDFQAVSTEMERLAFGPPAENVGRMLTLIDRGLVSLDSLDVKSPTVPVDSHINAIVPSPTDVEDDSVLGGLRHQKIIRRHVRSGGIEVNDAARPMDTHGNPVAGLAIVGRATEGCVLGNDTLSRRMHHHPERWARQIVQAVQAQMKRGVTSGRLTSEHD